MGNFEVGFLFCGQNVGSMRSFAAWVCHFYLVPQEARNKSLHAVEEALAAIGDGYVRDVGIEILAEDLSGLILGEGTPELVHADQNLHLA